MSTLKSTVAGLTLLAMGVGLLGNAKAQDKSAAPVYIEHQKVSRSRPS